MPLNHRDLISKPELLAIVPLSYPAIWKLARDGKFPRGIYIGQRAMWYLDEVEKWIDERPRQKFGAERDPIDHANKVKAARAGHEARRRRADAERTEHAET